MFFFFQVHIPSRERESHWPPPWPKVSTLETTQAFCTGVTTGGPSMNERVVPRTRKPVGTKEAAEKKRSAQCAHPRLWTTPQRKAGRQERVSKTQSSPPRGPSLPVFLFKFSVFHREISVKNTNKIIFYKYILEYLWLICLGFSSNMFQGCLSSLVRYASNS